MRRIEQRSARAVQFALWLVPIVAALAMFRHPLSFADLGWQMRIGERMVQEGPFLRERFVSGHLGEWLLPNAWLAQMVYARLLGLTGWAGLRAFDAMLWLAGPLIATFPARMRGERPLAIIYALAIGIAVAMPSASIRPQSFASLGFGLTLVVVSRLRSGRKAVLLGLPLFVLWQNFHPSVPVAAMVIGAVAVVRWGLALTGRGERPVALTLLALGAGLAVLVTPAGWSLIPFARDNAVASVAFGATEWLPLWHPHNRYFLVAVLVAMALVVMAWIRVWTRQGQMPSPDEWPPVVITCALTLMAARFIPFFAIAVIPPLTRLGLGGAASGTISSRIAVQGMFLALLPVVPLSLAMPIRPANGDGQPLFAALAGSTRPGPVFSDPALGGIVVYFGAPAWTVAFDGRFFLYDPRETALLQRTGDDPSVLADIERGWHPVAFALNRSRSAALVRALEARPDLWREVYASSASVVFVPAR